MKAKYIKARRRAWMHFWPEGNGRAKPGYHLHHIDPSWKSDDPERYNAWNIEDLVVMKAEDHIGLHSTLQNQDPNSRWGSVHSWGFGEDNCNWHNKLGFNGPAHPMFGKHHTEEQKRKWSEERSGEGNPMYGKSSWEKCTPEERADRIERFKNSIKGKNKGKHWWNNGEIAVFRRECPEGFVAGTLRKKKKQ